MTNNRFGVRPVLGDEYASDADREYYLGALASARQDGRLDAVEHERRVTAVGTARRRSDLEALIADVPRPATPPPPTPRPSATQRIVVWTTVVALAAGIGWGVGSVVNAIRDRAVEPAAGDSSVLSIEQPIEVPITDMYAPGALAGALNELAADEGLTAYSDVYVWPDRITLDALIGPDELRYDSVTVTGPGSITRNAGGTEPQEWIDQYFTADDFDPNAIAAVAAQAADVAGVPGTPIQMIVISRDSIDGTVQIRVDLEDDAYGTSPSVEWDGTGQHLLEVRE